MTAAVIARFAVTHRLIYFVVCMLTGLYISFTDVPVVMGQAPAKQSIHVKIIYLCGSQPGPGYADNLVKVWIGQEPWLFNPIAVAAGTYNLKVIAQKLSPQQADWIIREIAYEGFEGTKKYNPNTSEANVPLPVTYRGPGAALPRLVISVDTCTGLRGRAVVTELGPDGSILVAVGPSAGSRATVGTEFHDGDVVHIVGTAKLKWLGGDSIISHDDPDDEAVIRIGPGGFEDLTTQRTMIKILGGALIFLMFASNQGEFIGETPDIAVRHIGTKFRLAYNAQKQMSTVSVEEGMVEVVPKNPTLRPFTLRSGQRVDVSQTAVSPIASIDGQAGGGQPGSGGAGIGPRVPASAPPPTAIDLTGLWVDNTGGGAVYRLRQVGNKVYWSVDAGKGGSINVYVGDISANTINGVWVDLPQSSTYLTGNLNLRIDSNDHLVKMGESPCCYGAQEWRRQGTTASAQPPPTTGSAGSSAGGGGPTPAPPAPAAGAGSGGAVPAPGSAIEWRTNAKAWRGKNGQHIPFTCPPNGAIREIWGTDIYTDDSPICVAAVHKGLITFEKGGQVTIEILPRQPGYTKSERNGVTSSPYPSFDGSYKFVANDVVGLFQRSVPPAAQGGWEGTWVQDQATYTITRSGTTITAVTNWKGDRKPVHEDNGQWTNCKINGNTATCDWRATYQDPDKTIARKGTLKLTLTGDRITGEQLEDEPVFTWRVSPYPSSMRKGMKWPLNLTRKK